jgi:hypothetical protein
MASLRSMHDVAKTDIILAEPYFSNTSEDMLCGLECAMESAKRFLQVGMKCELAAIAVLNRP